VIKILKFFIIGFVFFSCSLGSGGGFWTNEKQLSKDKLKFTPIFEKKEFESQEFNKNLIFSLKDLKFKKNDNSNLNNNDGYTLINEDLKSISKYNFSKIKNFNIFEPNLIFNKGNVVFFDNKGTIFNFDSQSKLIWKINNYSKDEKKVGPLLILAKKNNKLIIADNLSKIYALDINNGQTLWSKKNDFPFNSQIKIFKNKFFVIDSSNRLNCFSLKDGNLIWSHDTEKSFINSFKKLSIIIKDEFVIFSNSIGDITAVKTDNGSLLWQRSTQNSKIYEDIMTLKTSDLIEDDDSIYFSNNKNKFYSLDLKSGTTNWTQDINSNLRPAIIGRYIFTISTKGYFFIIEKNTGNIIKITNLFKNFNVKKKKSLFPTGFIFNLEKLFITTNNGKLIIADIKTSEIKDILKIDADIISRPFVHDKSMFLIKNDSVIKLN
jgi:outer membrane protein assembly factor BamB